MRQGSFRGPPFIHILISHTSENLGDSYPEFFVRIPVLVQQEKIIQILSENSMHGTASGLMPHSLKNDP
jgi:hypothetical protein